MLKSESFVGPFVTMVLLFFVVGFLTVVNQQFQSPLQEILLSKAPGIKNALATLITFSFFLAYPLCGGMASNWIDKLGYKKSLIRALFVLFVGLSLFLLSVVFEYYTHYSLIIMNNEIPIAFFIFLIGSFVIGASLTVVQVVVNPYLIACQVKGTSGVQRQMIGGSSNSIGTTIAPFFVTSIVFGGIALSEIKITNLIIPFLILMIATIAVASIINRLSLPNIEGTTNEGNRKLEKSIWSFSHLKLGVMALFCYVGVEVAIGANINLYAKSLGGSYAVNASMMASLYWAGMLVGRLISSMLNRISPQIQLTMGSLIALFLVSCSIILSNPWLLVLVGLFHSVMWSSIFTLAIDKLGVYTSKASGKLMIGALGGGIFPLLMGMMADEMGGNWRWTWLVVLVGEIVILYYGLKGYKIKVSDVDAH